MPSPHGSKTCLSTVLNLRDAAVHEQFGSCDVAGVVGCEKYDRLRDLIGRAESAERNRIGNYLLALFTNLGGSQQLTQSGRVDRAWAYRRWRQLATDFFRPNASTSATNLCSNGDVLSFLQMRSNGSRTFMSATRTKATPRGQCQREDSVIQESPTRHWTSPKLVSRSAASWTMRGAVRPPRAHACIISSVKTGLTQRGHQTNGMFRRSRNRTFFRFVSG